MRQLLNTLYVTTPEAYISRDGLNVVVSVEQTEKFRVPAVNIEAIVTFGYKGASPGLMQLCAERGISLCFLSPFGRFVARVQGPVQGNVLLRTAQYALAADTPRALGVARLMVAAKVQNYRAVLRRYVRDYGPAPEVDEAAGALDNMKHHALRAADRDELMGCEGMAANRYFAVLPRLMRAQQDGFPFQGRNRRPPRDAVNAMLSFAYTLATNDCAAALEAVGLDPYVGFLHTMRPGRAALALDLVEELRAYLGDRFVLSLINNRQITPAHFLCQADSGVAMTDDGRRIFIGAWQKRKRETITHPLLGEKVEIGLLPHVQAMMMARFIRKEIDEYPVFLIK